MYSASLRSPRLCVKWVFMKILDRTESLALLGELRVLRLAGYDAERAACYAVPLAFALADDGAVLIAVRADGRMAQLLHNQRRGICLEADDVRPNLSFRSVIGTVDVHSANEISTLAALARRYGAEWERWRPTGAVATFRLEWTSLQGREKR